MKTRKKMSWLPNTVTIIGIALSSCVNEICQMFELIALTILYINLVAFFRTSMGKTLNSQFLPTSTCMYSQTPIKQSPL